MTSFRSLLVFLAGVCLFLGVGPSCDGDRENDGGALDASTDAGPDAATRDAATYDAAPDADSDPQPPGPVSPAVYYKLDETSGAAMLDATGHTTGAAAYPGEGIVSAKVNNGRALDGGSGHLRMGNLAAFNGATALTISAWVNLNRNTGRQAFITKWGDDGNTFWTELTDGLPRAAFAPGAFIAAPSFALQPNRWYLITWVYDGAGATNEDRLKLYVNGSIQTLSFASSTVPSSLPSSVTPVNLGSFDDGSGMFLAATVDEIGIWTDALTQEHILNIFDSRTGKSCSSPCMSYPVVPATTAEQWARAERIHNEAIVVLAHTHNFLSEDLESAKRGGATAITAKLITDGIDWDRPTRTRTSVTSGFADLFTQYLDGLTSLENTADSGVMLVRDAADIYTVKEQGKIGVIIGSEGANHLEGDIANVQRYYDMGWRETQLRWSANLLSDGIHLTEFGRQVVRECNRLGILLDASHMNTSELSDLLSETEDPIIWSHGIPSRSMDGELSNPILDAVIDSGGGHGVIALHFCTCYTGSPNAVEYLLQAVDYIKQRSGIDHVALGADYTPEDLPMAWAVPVDYLQEITLGLVRRGYTDQEIQKVLGLNLVHLYERVWE